MTIIMMSHLSGLSFCVGRKLKIVLHAAREYQQEFCHVGSLGPADVLLRRRRL